MTEDELGAYKVYLRLNMGAPSKKWEEAYTARQQEISE